MKTFLIFAGIGLGWIAAAWALWRLLFYRRSELDLDYEPERSLEGRIVFCANCEAKGVLYKSSSGQLLCGLCGSPSWVFEIPRQQLVKREEEVKQLAHLWQLMPNDLPVERRAQWVEDVKRRAEVRVGKANRRDAADGGQTTQRGEI